MDDKTRFENMENFDVMPLLSCISEMNYLRRKYQLFDLVHPYERVANLAIDDKMLSGKYIVLCCFNLPVIDYYNLHDDDFNTICPQDLIAACHDLFFVRDDFEMVVVIKPNETDASHISNFNGFSRHLPAMCLVVPFEDSKRRDFICKYLDLGDLGLKCVLVNVEKQIVCQGDYDSMPNFIECLQDLYRECSFDLPRCYGRLVKSMWPVVREEQSKPCVRNVCPIARKLKVEVPEFPDEINKMCLELRSLCPIELVKFINVVSLLVGVGDLNYLVRNDGERVEVEGKVFSGKYVMVCCFYVPVFREDEGSMYIQSLATTCYDLYSTRNDFEMVVVVKMNKLANHELVFNHFLSGFPSSCLVVPFKDSKRRDFICRYLGLGIGIGGPGLGPDLGKSIIRCLVLNKDEVDFRRNLRCGCPNFLWNHGADAFPFSFEKLQELRANDWPIWATPSTSTLEGLLGCSPSDFVYKNNSAGVREQVTISKLSENLVVLCLTGFDTFIPILHKVYEHCRAQNLAFEVVLVYMPSDDCLDPEVNKAKVDSVLQKQNISWWRLPFNNSVSRRLKRLTNGPWYNNQLIIVGPHDNYVEPYGAEIINQFGIDAFPFTREGLVESGLMRLRELTLDSLLVYGSRNYVIRGNYKVAVSELKGRNILLYLDYYLVDNLTLYHELLIWYDEIKAKHPTFEVVFVRLQSMHTSIIGVEDESELSAIMPWLICPFDPDHSASLAKKIFFKGYTRDTLIQFGKDGRICSTRAQDLLRNYGSDAFPFGDNLRQDVICELQSFIYRFIDMM